MNKRGVLVYFYESVIFAWVNYDVMTLGQFEYRYRNIKPCDVVSGQLPDMGVWGSLRLLKRMDFYIDKNVQKHLMRDHRSLMADLSLARSFGMYQRVDELSKRVKELSDGYLRFSAAKFFTEHCGWAWGGASLESRDVSYVSGDYVIHGDDAPPDGPVVQAARFQVALMDVYRCGNRIQIPAVGLGVYNPKIGEVFPDAVADVILYPVISKGVLDHVVLAGYAVCGVEVLLGGESSLDLLNYAVRNTERYLTGELYRAAEDASRKAWERSLAEAAAKRREQRRNRWKVDRCPEPSDWDSEVETLEALGYDVEKYIHDRDYWMYW